MNIPFNFRGQIEGIPGGTWVAETIKTVINAVSAAWTVQHNDDGSHNVITFGATTGPSLGAVSGTPEGVVAAPVGSIRLRRDGIQGTTIYTKVSGIGAAGWVAGWGSVTASMVLPVGITVDGAGSVLTTGIKGSIQVPFNATISAWTILADQAGSVVFDVWKDTFGNYPPTAGDTICGSAKPTLSSAAAGTSTTLTGWTTTLTAGDVLRFNIDSASTLTKATLELKVTTS